MDDIQMEPYGMRFDGPKEFEKEFEMNWITLKAKLIRCRGLQSQAIKLVIALLDGRRRLLKQPLGRSNWRNR